MAFVRNFPNIVLDVEDVPGAVLPFKEVASNSVTALKRWLLTRGISTTGNKAELVERVKGCSSIDLPVDVRVDGGKWYDMIKVQKLKALPSASVDLACHPPVPPVSGWNDFPSIAIPKYFNDGNIYHYLVETPRLGGFAPDSNNENVAENDSNKENVADLQIAKPLQRGNIFFKSGHVQDIKDCIKGDFYFAKCCVRASFENCKHSVHVTIHQKTGMVYDGSCTCKASSMGRCSHVSALLQAITDYVARYGNEACTSKPCTWNQGRKHLRSPKKLSECHKDKKFKVIDFDPRCDADKKSSASVVREFRDIVKRHEPASATGRNKQPSGWALILGCAQTVKDDVSDDLEPRLTEERTQVLSECRKEFLEALKPAPTSDNPHELISEQGSAEWMKHRRLRLTASMCKAVKTAQAEHTKSNILKRHLYSGELQTKEIVYGREKESEAFLQYRQYVTSKEAYSVQQSGLWVNAEYPELACSPDGVVLDTEGGRVGLVEIKCPFLLSDVNVEEFSSVLSKQQQRSFCLERHSDGSIRLKRNHMYYFQVQMQMGVMQLEWCDFFVWSPHSFVVERVHADEIFWEALKRSLVAFHHQYLVPEYFEMRVARGLSAVCLK